jgi:hypothetical protein
VALVHLEQVAGEQRRLVAAGAGADLHHAAAAVGVLAAERHRQQFIPQRLAAFDELGELRLGELAHVGVFAGRHLARFDDLLAEVLERPVLARELGQRPVLARGRRQLRRVGQHALIAQVALELLEPGELRFKQVTHRKWDVGSAKWDVALAD